MNRWGPRVPDFQWGFHLALEVTPTIWTEPISIACSSLPLWFLSWTHDQSRSTKKGIVEFFLGLLGTGVHMALWHTGSHLRISRGDPQDKADIKERETEKRNQDSLVNVLSCIKICLMLASCLLAFQFRKPIHPLLFEPAPLKKKKYLASNHGAGEDFWESLGQQGNQTSQSYRKSTLNIHWKDWRWSWSSKILAAWGEELIHWKRPWCWERLKAGGEGDDRGWDGWMASPTRHEFEQTPGGSEGQRSRVCCSPWGHIVSHMTERVNTTTNKINLAVSGLSWGTQDLPLHLEVFLGVAHGLNCSAACGILVPPPGIEPESPALQGGFLTTGPPGSPLNQPCVVFLLLAISRVLLQHAFKINTWLQSMAVRLAEHCEFNSLGKYFSLLRRLV